MLEYSFVSTGLSSGLGGVAKRYIDVDQADLHHIMLCRDPEKVAYSANLSLIKCDLSSISSVKEAIAQIKKLVDDGTVPPIKFLLNNAGASFNTRTNATEDGYEATFQINVIAPFIIVRELLPYLRRAPEPRVFVTGSNVHFADQEHNHGFVPPLYWNDDDVREIMLPTKTGGDPDPTTSTAGSRAYAVSKMAVLYLMYKFAADKKDVKFIVYEPGFVPTSGLFRDIPQPGRLMFSLGSYVFRMLGWATTVPKAGKLLAQCAFDDKIFEQANNVAYCDQGKIISSSSESYNKERQEQLWNELLKCAQ
jgi:protochlorophyllide reductase